MGIRVLVTAALVALAACAGPQKADAPAAKKAAQALPGDYASWPKLNEETIVRSEEDEQGTVTSSSAVELFAKIVGDLDVGTLLVKQTSALEGDTLGPIQQIGVMRKTRGASNGGWAFEAYEPQTLARANVDVSTCSNCHSLQADNDYLFSSRESVVQDAPSDGPPGF